MYPDPLQRLNSRIAKIFDSKNDEWIMAISVTVDLMYEQFVRETNERTIREQRREKAMNAGDVYCQKDASSSA